MNQVADNGSRMHAVNYARWVLEHGKALSNVLLVNLNFAAFDVAFIPAVTIVSEDDLKHGLPTRFESSIDAKATLIQSLVREVAPDGGLIFEDGLAERGDEWIAQSASRIIYVGDNVLVEPASLDAAGIESALNDAENAFPPVVGVIYRDPLFAGRSVNEPVECSPKAILDLVKQARVVIVGAFDGVGYILFHRTHEE